MINIKRIRRIFMAILAAAILTAAFSFSAAAADGIIRDFTAELAASSALKSLGLFQGVGTNTDGSTDFALNRAPTRLEALVMLIRLLGKDAEARDCTSGCPFTDVPDWGKPYVTYAYENRLTNGSSATEFGMGNATAAMYITFTLRALGYSDEADGDFKWDAPETLASQLGLLNEQVALDDFLRADVVLISEAALTAQMKDGSGLLLDKLISAGVFTGTEYNAAFPDSPVKRGEVQNSTPEYEKEPVTLSTGARDFVFTIVNVDEMTGMTELYLSDGSYSGGDWQTTEKGWVKFEITNKGLKTEFSCYSNVDFENVPDLKIRYTKNGNTNTALFGCAIENGGRYWLDELAEHLMTKK